MPDIRHLKPAQITVGRPVRRLNHSQALSRLNFLGSPARLLRVLPVCGAMPAKVIAVVVAEAMLLEECVVLQQYLEGDGVWYSRMQPLQPCQRQNHITNSKCVNRTRLLLQTTTLTAMHTLVRQQT